MIIDSTTKRPIPVAIMQHCSAATDLLRRKMGQWADTKNKESPSYRRRSAVSPIHNLARDMNNGTIWKNKERLMLLTMTPEAMVCILLSPVAGNSLFAAKHKRCWKCGGMTA